MGTGSNPLVGTGSVVLIGGTNPTSPATIQSTFIGKGAGSVLSGNAFPQNFATDIWTPLTTLPGGLKGMSANSTFDKTTGVFMANPGTKHGGLEYSDLGPSGCRAQSYILGLAVPGRYRDSSVTCHGQLQLLGGVHFWHGGRHGERAVQCYFRRDECGEWEQRLQWDTSILARQRALLTSSQDIFGTIVANSFDVLGGDRRPRVSAAFRGTPACVVLSAGHTTSRNLAHWCCWLRGSAPLPFSVDAARDCGAAAIVDLPLLPLEAKTVPAQSAEKRRHLPELAAAAPLSGGEQA